jgi:hypothetical protein
VTHRIADESSSGMSRGAAAGGRYACRLPGWPGLT